MKKSLLTFLALTSFASAELEVHEWGTFTTLSDSTGRVLRWYTPQSDHSALPAFVGRNSALMKYNMFTTVRMETPVIYFYPDQPMEVDVAATFQNGAITELYPSAVVGDSPSMNPTGATTRWKGRLLPPNDVNALNMIPTVSSDERGAHYAAAREVPDAWIFHHKAPLRSPEEGQPAFTDEADKFIFYRGAGDFPINLSFSNSDEAKIDITNHGKHNIQQGVLLEVQDGAARWSTLPVLEKMGEEAKTFSTQITGSWKPIDQIETELTHWFQNTLTSEGLTSKEATAMIATWQGSWFRESGLRAFTIMPREAVDEVLPLSITPKPEKLVRVFVHRHEMIRSSHEKELATIISDLRIPDEEAARRLTKLELGRFSSAVIYRATDIVRGMAFDRFHSLQKAEAK